MGSITNNGMAMISAIGVNIIKRYEYAELIAVLHDNGRVGLYAEDDDMLWQMTPLMASNTLSPMAIADKLIGK